MKISPVRLEKINSIHYLNPSKKVLNTQKEPEFRGISNVHHHFINFNKKDYDYKPLASVKPITTPVGHYDNLDKFCELFASKINSQLLAPSEEDIENLIKEVQFKTKADEKEVKEVLYNLTAFSGYQSFDIISETIKKHNIGQFGFRGGLLGSLTKSLSNCAIDYLIRNKKFCECRGEKIGIVLDNQTITAIENLKKSKSTNDKKNYKRFIEYIKDGDIIFLNLKGWDIKTKNNGYKSANFLTGSGYLKDLAIETIDSLKSGKSEDEIYYSDFKERLYELIKGDVKKEKLHFEDVYPKAKTNIASKDILDNLKPKTITKEQIKAYIEAFSRYTQSKFDREYASPVFSKYLDEMTRAYSIDSLAVALKNLHEKIKKTAETLGEDESNLSYIVPDVNKSFSIISAMYALVNNLSQEDFDNVYTVSERNKAKTKVVLDDVSGSGTTEKKVICNYKFYQDEKIKIIYAPVILCKKALDCPRSIYDYPSAHSYEVAMHDLSEIKDLLLSRDFPNPDGLDDTGIDYNQKLDETIKRNFKILTKDDLKTLFDKLDTGYDDLSLSIAFPYMIPDNCSDLASLILKNLLFVENEETNKPFKYYKIKGHKGLIDSYREINYLAKEFISSGRA